MVVMCARHDQNRDPASTLCQYRAFPLPSGGGRALVGAARRVPRPCFREFVRSPRDHGMIRYHVRSTVVRVQRLEMRELIADFYGPPKCPQPHTGLHRESRRHHIGEGRHDEYRDTASKKSKRKRPLLLPRRLTSMHPRQGTASVRF